MIRHRCTFLLSGMLTLTRVGWADGVINTNEPVVGIEKAKKLSGWEFLEQARRLNRNLLQWTESNSNRKLPTELKPVIDRMVREQSELRMQIARFSEERSGHRAGLEPVTPAGTNGLSAPREDRIDDDRVLETCVGSLNKMITLFTTASQEMADDSLKALAVGSLPILQKELEEVHRVELDLQVESVGEED